MADKCSGDSLKCSVKANPLLSSAVIGLSIEDFTHRAVLCPIPATSDAQDATEELRPQNTTLSTPEPKPLSASRNTNTLHFAPVHKPSFPLNPDSSTTIAKSQIDTSSDDNPTQSNAYDKSKKHDDFDVNEYFARLQGTRYVSAPLNTNLAKEINQNMPVEEESAFSEINLCEDSQGNISNTGEDFQNSITADIAQNFSQLPQVLPQMASAVFSSFSSILNMNKPNKQETVPSAPNYGHSEVSQRFSQNVEQSGSFTVDQSIRPPSIERKPEIPMNPVPMFNATDYQGGVNAVSQNKNMDAIGKVLTKPPNNIGSGNQYRLSSKKKTYAPVPSLQYGTQSDKNPPRIPVPNLPPMPPFSQNTATSQSSSLLSDPMRNYSVPEKESFNMTCPPTSAISYPNIFVPSFSETSSIPNVTSSTPYGIAATEIPTTVLYVSSNISIKGLETEPNLKSMLNIEHNEHPTVDSLAPTTTHSSPNIFVPNSIENAAPLLVRQESSPSSTFELFPESSVPIINQKEESSFTSSIISQTGGLLSLSQKIDNFKSSFFNPFGSSQSAIPTNLDESKSQPTQYAVVPPMTQVAQSSHTITPLSSNVPFSGSVETVAPIFFDPSTFNPHTPHNFSSESTLPMPISSFSIDKSSEAPPIPSHSEKKPFSGEHPKNMSGNKFRLQNKKRLQYYSGPIDGQEVCTPKAIETTFPTPPQPFSNPLGSVSYFNPHTSQEGSNSNAESQIIQLTQERQFPQNDMINGVNSVGQNTPLTMFNPYTAHEQNLSTPGIFPQPQNVAQPQEDLKRSSIFTPTQLPPINKSDFEQNCSVFNPYSNQTGNTCFTNSQSNIVPQNPDNLSDVALFTPNEQTTQINETSENTHQNVAQPQEDLKKSSIFTPTQLPTINKSDFEHNNVPSVFNPYSNQTGQTCVTNSQSNVVPQTQDNLSNVALITPNERTTQTNATFEKTPSILHPHASPVHIGSHANIELTSFPEFNVTQNIAQTIFTPGGLPNVVKDTFQKYNTPYAMSQSYSLEETSNSSNNNRLFSSRQLNVESQEINPQTQGNCNSTSTFTIEKISNPPEDTSAHTPQGQINISYSSSNETFQSSAFNPDEFADSKTPSIINPHPDFTSPEHTVTKNVESDIALNSNLEKHPQIQGASNSTVTLPDIPIQDVDNFGLNNTFPNFNPYLDSTSSKQYILQNTQTYDNNSSSALVSNHNYTPLQAEDNFAQISQTLPIPVSDQQSVAIVHSNINSVVNPEKLFLSDSSLDFSTVEIKDNTEHTTPIPEFRDADKDEFNLSAETKDHFSNTAIEDSFKHNVSEKSLGNAENMKISDVSEIFNDIEREITKPTSDLRDNSIDDMTIGDYMHFGLPQNEEGSNMEIDKSKIFPANASDEFKAEFKNIIIRDKIESLENISFEEDDIKEYKNAGDLDEIKKIPITELTQKQFEYLADNAKDSQTFHKDYYEKFDVVATTDDDKLVRSDDIQKFEKLNIAESTNIQSSCYKQSISSPVSVGSFTSYFDTGNFAVENYLKNNQTIPPAAQNSSTLSKPDIVECTKNVETEVSQTVDDNLTVLPDPLQFFNATDFEAPRDNNEENLLAKYFSFPQETSNSSNSRPISSFREDLVTNVAAPIHSHTNSPVSENNSISFSSNSGQSTIQSFFH